MSTFAKSFRDEVNRLARKEAKAAVAPIRKPAGANRSTLADIKRRVAALEKETRRLAVLLAKLSSSHNLQPNSIQPSSKARITGKGMRSLRRKLGLSAELFGILLNVSGPAVYAWEKRNGPLRVRETTRKAILSIRGMGAKEARKRLNEERETRGVK